MSFQLFEYNNLIAVNISKLKDNQFVFLQESIVDHSAGANW